MKLISFVLMLFFSISVGAQNCCDLKLAKCPSVKELAKEYKRLRNFNNNERNCCDKFGSGLMKIMDLLGDSLNLRVSKKRIIELMGKPDNYASKDNPIEHHFEQLEKNELVLIYYWRGMHDFLYLGIKDNKLIYKDWYYAYE